MQSDETTGYYDEFINKNRAMLSVYTVVKSFYFLYVYPLNDVSQIRVTVRT